VSGTWAKIASRAWRPMIGSAAANRDCCQSKDRIEMDSACNRWRPVPVEHGLQPVDYRSVIGGEVVSRLRVEGEVVDLGDAGCRRRAGR